MAYSRFDGLEIMMQQDDKISVQLEEVDDMIDKKLRFKEDILSESTYITEHLKDIDHLALNEIETEPSSTDIVDIEVDDIIDANNMDDDIGALIDIVAEI